MVVCGMGVMLQGLKVAESSGTEFMVRVRSWMEAQPPGINAAAVEIVWLIDNPRDREQVRVGIPWSGAPKRTQHSVLALRIPRIL